MSTKRCRVFLDLSMTLFALSAEMLLRESFCFLDHVDELVGRNCTCRSIQNSPSIFSMIIVVSCELLHSSGSPNDDSVISQWRIWGSTRHTRRSITWVGTSCIFFAAFPNSSSLMVSNDLRFLGFHSRLTAFSVSVAKYQLHLLGFCACIDNKFRAEWTVDMILNKIWKPAASPKSMSADTLNSKNMLDSLYLLGYEDPIGRIPSWQRVFCHKSVILRCCFFVFFGCNAINFFTWHWNVWIKRKLCEILELYWWFVTIGVFDNRA